MADRGAHRGRGQQQGRGGPPGQRGGGGGGSGGRGTPDRGRGQSFEGRGGPGGGGRGGPGRGGGRGGAPAIFAENVPTQLAQRLTPSELKSLVDGFKSIQIKPERPLRPGWGTTGTPITLRANFFALRVPQSTIYDYVVEISPKTDVSGIKSRLFDLLERDPLCSPHVPYIAHDRSQRLVSARKLPQPLNIQVQFYEDDTIGPSANSRMYMVSIKFERELDPRKLTRYMEGHAESHDYNSLPLISALNLVLQQHASRVGARVGKNRFFFPLSSQTFRLGPGLEAVQGFYTSVRPTYKQLMVNVNVCMTAFIVPGNLADRLLEFGQSSRGSMPTLPKSMVKSIKVKTLHLGYKKKLNAIGTTPARTTFFDCEEFGGRISVESYFQKKYGKKLRHHSDLPVVDLGNARRPNWVPAELCIIEPGNAYRGKLSDRDTAQMIKYACNPPGVNAEAIVRTGLPTLGIAQPPQSPVNGFGIEINSNMTDIPARELNAPGLAYRVGRPKVQNGSWNILEVKFHRGARINSWWVFVIRDGRTIVSGPNDPNLQNLVKGFGSKLDRSGVAVPPGLPYLCPPAVLPNPQGDPDRTLALNIIRGILTTELTKRPKPSFILVLLENRDNYIYPGIKCIGDVELGIHTVHMQLEKAFIGEKQDQYFSNVALKVNTKLGGMNHLLDEKAMRWLTKKKTMMVGIDVTHPGPTSREGTPSIAAVVASVDDDFVQFPASIRIQESKKEMLDELTDMMVERLLVYERKNKVLPARIIIYRDGVSEGQFDTVLDEELPQVLNAFKKLNTSERKVKYKPQLSIVVCGKRHHARFFPTNSQYASKNGNTRPGTVVDKGITGVFDFDFYLQAHAGLQGHVKSTHYTVVYDEIGLQADEIQQGTHDASYLYARATKAVSLVPAAYYADLACERGRCYLNEFLDDRTSTAGGSSRGRLSREEEKKHVFDQAKRAWGEGLHPDMRESMFYI